ncbi:glycosyltransferase family 2 protein [Curtobacterium sp. MCBD17_013]|nr:glycosyltransferase family 2 protein [Curtobacterium sp. MCBD17_013]
MTGVMQPRVTAILVCANGAEFLDRTLDALAAQTRPPEALVVVDVGSTDGSTDELSFGGSAQLARIPAGRPFGEAVAQGERVAPHAAPDESVDEWLWLIGHDNAPAPTALAELLAAVEIAPSVAVAGPKVMVAQEPTRIREFGESMTRFGRSTVLVADELDQGQHDAHADVLGVGVAGMLVRRSVWTALGGFDPGLPHVDAALDFCVRARLAGHRVSVVPEARVTSAGGPEDFGRRSVSETRRLRFRRQAQLHRRLVYAPPAVLWLHWLSLVPLAIVRSVGRLVAKHPGAVGAEIGAAVAVAFGGGVGRARRTLARNRRVGWAAVEPLRVSLGRVREHRVTARDLELARVEDAAVPRASFLGDGGLWTVLAAAVVTAVLLGPLLGAPALTGGGLLPLSTTVGRLWQNVGYGWHTTGFTGPSDPFAAVLAVLGTLTFWSPSTSIVLVMLLAVPLSALGAWFASRRLTTRVWVPVVGATLYALSPSLVTAVMSGHVGAVIAHVLLPWLLLTLLGAHRSWASSAGAALLFAAVLASAPSLIPVLVLTWLASLAFGWRHLLRRIAIPLPAVVLFAPLVITQLRAGTPLGVLADPGVPDATRAPSALQLAIGSPLPDWNGWTTASHAAGFATTVLPIALAVLALPVGATAIGALLGRRWHLAAVALGFAFVGYLTAFGATHLALSGVGSTTTIVWPGSGLSVSWFALVVAAVVGLDTLPRLAPGLGLVAAVLTGVTVAPVFAGLYLGTAAISPTTGRVISAYVNAEARTNPDVGTLVLTPQRDGTLGVSLERGQGATLDDQSTVQATAHRLSPDDRRLTTLAANLASRSGFDPREDLRRLGVRFVLLADGPDSRAAEALHDRAAGSIGQDARFTSIGATGTGVLWTYDGRVDRPATGTAAASAAHALFLVVLGVVFGATALLAIPTGPRRRRAVSHVIEADEPATTFDEERE